jgi:hypothetical protein
VLRKCPFWCENAFGGIRRIARIFQQAGRVKDAALLIPLWYPLAFKFRRLAE